MDTLRRSMWLAGLVLVVAQMACAATYVVDFTDLNIELNPLAALNFVNLGAELTGITDVSVRVEGIGGGGNFACSGNNPDGWYELDVVLLVGGGKFTIPTENQVAFDQIAAQSLFEPNPWERMEGTSSYAIGVMGTPHGVAETYSCESDDATLPVLHHVELTIVADSLVPTEKLAWGTIKAQYSEVR